MSNSSVTVRFEELGNKMRPKLQAIRNSIIHTTKETFSFSVPKESRAVVLFDDGESWISRFEKLGETADINQAIESMTRAVELLPQGHPVLSAVLDRLGHAYERRFRHFGILDDIDKSIEHKKLAIQGVHESHEGLPSWLSNLGNSYGVRFWRLSELSDVDNAIACHTRTVSLTPNGHRYLPGRFRDLGNSHYYRFTKFGYLGDIDQAVEYQTRAVKLTPDWHPSLTSYLNSLETSYEKRFQQLGHLEDSNSAINTKTRAIKLTPEGSRDLPGLLESLGTSYESRFWRLGELADIDKSIELNTRAVALAPENHMSLPGRLNNLANSYRHRFERLGKVEDCNNAIRLASRAVSLTSIDHSGLASMLYNLSIPYGSRFNSLGDLADCEVAIEHGTRAVMLTPEAHSDLPMKLGNLSYLYENRFRRLDNIQDIDTAIDYAIRAVQLAPDGHADLPTWLGQLGTAHHSRFGRLGEVHDIDRAVTCKSRAVMLTSDDHSDMSSRLSNLGTSYIDRFYRLNESRDLDKAIEHGLRAVALAPDGHADLAIWLSNLSGSYSARFKNSTQLEDLQKEIEYAARAVILTSESHSYMSIYLMNLGKSKETRFKQLGDLDDLDTAMEHQTRAIELAPAGHARLPAWLCNLGVSYELRFERLGSPEDLHKAVEYKSHAVKIAPETHATLPFWLFQLANAHIRQFQIRGDLRFMTDAMHSLRKAATSSVGHPKSLLKASRKWGQVASSNFTSDSVEAYAVALNLVPKLIWLGFSVDKRYENLHLIEDLAVEAAAAAINAHDYNLALEWLEQTRSIVWNQMLQLRAPLDQLESIQPMLATRLRHVAYELQSSELSINYPNGVPQSRTFSLEESAQQHRRRAEEYDNILHEIRKLPKFQDFLQPKNILNLAQATRNGPVVIINCDKSRCDALILLPGEREVACVPLPNFSYTKPKKTTESIAHSLGQLNLRGHRMGPRRRPFSSDENEESGTYERILAELWDDIVKPVLGFLGYMQQAVKGNLPRITWCLTGLLSFLPLHAAGCYDQPDAMLSNYAISSYAPTVGALLTSSPPKSRSGCRILAVSQESTPGHTRLPGTTQELAQIDRHIEYPIRCTRLCDSDVTIEAVLNAMESHDWVHLACHAHQDAHSPSDSGFFLYDGTLNISSIRQRQFQSKGLAFLSACQTAAGDVNLADEGVHLASGMLMAGYPSVIATMWSVMDSDAPLMADKVYGQLLRDGTLHCEDAAQALHYAVAELRDKVGYKEFTRWVPYIHIGS
ncbi:Serine/threonine-protein kinase TOR1 [Rhizoctonia solani]|uniref:Serine/threonine-protein kinase TOR1 n=1 Tax=Rhizoctonia solani TaxID=456999 RepID=A0A0K6GCT2_9AGAM|nr:Serine/threonine-protein kinase TOR1 [Rhizoctonia solani]